MVYIYFIHLVGAIAVGFYLLLPFLVRRISLLTASDKEGFVSGMFISNRIGQYILILQFISGGYLISQKPYTILWIVAVIVIFVLMSALAGMMGKAMKRAMADFRTGEESAGETGKIFVYALVVSVCMLWLIVLMSFPMYR